jgi:hypothetical protein
MEFEKNIFKSKDGEKLLGKVADIELEFISILKETLNCVLSVDELIITIKEITDFLTELEENYSQNKDAIIKVWHNPMGAYQYEEIDI